MILLSLLAVALGAAKPPAIGHALMQLAGEGQPPGTYAGAMAPEAWLLDPDVEPAQVVLARRTDAAPQRSWWPARTVTSCDGGLAVSTGTVAAAGTPAHRFVTVWERQTDRQWRWVFDTPLAEDAAGARPKPNVDLTAACGRVKAVEPDASWAVSGESGDGTLRWRVLRVGEEGDRHRLVAEYLTKAGWTVFEDATVG